MLPNYVNTLKKHWISEGSETPANKQNYFLEQIQKTAALFSPGPFYYYVVNVQDIKLEFVSPKIEDILGILPSEFSLVKLSDLIHPDDLDLVLKMEMASADFFLKFIDPALRTSYKACYMFRLKNSDGDYKNILQQTFSTTLLDNSITNFFCIHTDISHVINVNNKKISFIGINGNPSWQNIDPENPDYKLKQPFSSVFSKRELAIIQLISEGADNSEIADKLNISLSTVRTHRRNILSKGNCKNISELLFKYLKEGMI